MNQLLKTSILMSLVCLALSGCEKEEYAAISCDSPNSDENTINCASSNGNTTTPDPETKFKNKGGVTGQVFSTQYWVNAQVCFDINLNGRCDAASEPVEQTYELGKFSFTQDTVEQSIDKKVPLLAINKDSNGQIIAMYAPSPLSATNSEDEGVNITLFTTLVTNEITYNPYHLDDISSAQESLTNVTLNINNLEVLAGSDYLNNSDTNIIEQAQSIALSLGKAQILDKDKHYLATAAMVDKMYQEESLTVVVSINDISKQGALSESISASLNQNAVTWDLDHAEELNVSINTHDGIAVIGSKYHNRLTVMDITSEQPQWLSSHLFADSPVERDEIDGLTGATEQVLTQVEITSDTQNAIVSVEKYNKDSEDIGVGIYRANIQNLYQIPNIRFAKTTQNDNNFFAAARLKGLALSNNGLITALVGDDRKLTLLNTADFSLDKQMSFDAKLRAVALNNDATLAFIGMLGSEKGVGIVDLQTQKQISFVDTGASYPDSIFAFSHSDKFAALPYKTNTLFIYSNETPTEPDLIYTVNATDKIKHFSISDDEKVVLVSLPSGKLELYSIENEVRLIDSFETVKDSEGINKSIKSITFTKNNKAIIAVENAVQILTYEFREASQWTEQDKLDWFNLHRSSS